MTLNEDEMNAALDKLSEMARRLDAATDSIATIQSLLERLDARGIPLSDLEAVADGRKFIVDHKP